MDNIEIVVPNSLQMGWCESPPFFCSGSKTARDIIENLVLYDSLPPHKFEDIMLENPSLPTSAPPQQNLFTLQRYMWTISLEWPIKFNLLHFATYPEKCFKASMQSSPPPAITSHKGPDPIAESKLAKGDGTWEISKEILGWVFHGDSGTIQLHEDKTKTVCQLIRKLLKRECVSANFLYEALCGL